ncbi:MAG: DUF3267 domain-containing protein [Bacteroidales bacterium]|jgi:hypothetical protein|nr:DUF3267 domain-containing protein [Bacteroidales bacterium]MDY0199236.1 DUF3267 domain-containing protein [Tenuifilaceae bacterium]
MDSGNQSNKVEYTIGMEKVNLLVLLLIFPIILLFLLPFSLIWGFESFSIGWSVITHYGFIIVLLGVVLHEFLHGITWALFAANGFKSIRFGVNWKWLTPYCHCKEALKAKHYAIGGLMPLIVMGIIPSLIALTIGNGMLLIFGMIFTWTAGGDIISIWMLRKIGKNTLVFDHPDKIGFYTIES